jgi:coenzyme F420-0:L-glutamate ligase/coenzyme F420-1:gamma-L-glutamate ligase
MRDAPLELRALQGLPEIRRGDDLAELIAAGLARDAITLRRGDALVIAQKVVSKSEGRFVDLATVTPSPRARELAATVRKDPRFVEVVLAESSAVVRAVPDILITRHRQGFVMANAGIDRSNVPGAGDDVVLLLPEDCDASARTLRERLTGADGVAPAVVISDSFGRPWRQGTVNVALGVAGMLALRDLRGGVDREGRVLQSTQIALADALAAAAGLVMGETVEGTPVVLARGLDFSGPLADGRSLIRPPDEDLFR